MVPKIGRVDGESVAVLRLGGDECLVITLGEVPGGYLISELDDGDESGSPPTFVTDGWVVRCSDAVSAAKYLSIYSQELKRLAPSGKPNR